ncbi:kinase-like protein [Rhizophagus irregularis]|nr:kinase-like protein [Rhizophagus irregularis]
MELKNCPECDRPTSFSWCMTCETNFMKGKFPYWTSENREIDELIQHTQLNASQACNYLEWIPFETLVMGKYIGSGGFSSIYSAVWMEGPRWNLDDSTQEWARAGPTSVALKRLDNSLNILSSYVDQIKVHHECIQLASFVETFGITKDSTSNYMIVMKYYETGNLYKYLDRHNWILSWKDIIDMLRGIAKSLEKIHIKGKFHKNLHGGNLFIGNEIILIDARIGDVGLYGPSCYLENRGFNQIYGVLPYIAPEVLHGESYSAASDIYSFGIIMNILATGKRPWYNRAHNISLAKDICDGERLEIPEDTPSFYAKLMRQCWDNEPGNRPTASDLCKKLNWINLICDNSNLFDDYYYISEEKRYKIISQLPKSYTHPKIHPEAYYTSRLLIFPELFKK